MTDAGFFRGTSADQDNRFANKQKKLLKELNVSPILNTKLNMSKINIETLKPWIEAKIKDILEKEDEILSESIYEHLAEKEPDGKNILMIIMGFAEESKASKFVEELWTKLVEVQESSNGVGGDALNDDDPRQKQTENDDKHDGNNSNNNDANDDKHKDSSRERQSRSRSRSGSPRSPTRDGPKRRTLEPGKAEKDNSRTPTPTRKPSESPLHSGSDNRSPGQDGEPRRRSRSSSRSGSSRSGSKSSSSSRSRSRSRSKSYSRSRSISRSRSRSPRFRRRSPYGGYRGRGSHSRSPSRGYRPRSRSPYRRGGFRGGSYRGSFGFRDRGARGMMGPYRGRRQSPPWAHHQRRHHSPRSPPRRRRGRSPSHSPRRRLSRSPPPYRRRSRSRSPPPHMARNIRQPYQQRPFGHMAMGDRPLPSRDIPRPMIPSPRMAPVDHRGIYRDVQPLPPRRHSPGLGSAMAHVPYIQPELGVALPKPSGSGMHSPSPSRKKHKKEKKHKKHKKHSSKKHSRDRSRSRSETPDKKRKKHKKHKKTKKHRS